MKVLVLAGPTGSGKTELLDRIFGRGAPSVFGTGPAGRLPGGAAVISADSMQAYRGMDIGTAKPDAGLRARLPHFLVDILDPGEQYTVGDFVRRADRACLELEGEGILPVVSGGTGFYIRNFICGMPTGPASEPARRAEVAADLTRLGAEALRAELARSDPALAARIAARDTYRLTRAVELLRSGGRPPSEFAPPSTAREGYDFLTVGVERPRAELYARIDARVDAMMAAGLEGEVLGLLGAGFGLESPGMRAIGYREFLEAWGADAADEGVAGPDGGRGAGAGSAAAGLRGGAGAREIAERIKLHTRQYAKRQMTFFRALPGITWIQPDPSVLAGLVEEFLSR